MKLDTIKSKASRVIMDSLHLSRLGRQKYGSQWGVVSTHYKEDLMWVELQDKKVSIFLEDRKGFLSYVEETVLELIPYDVIDEEVQYKIF